MIMSAMCPSLIGTEQAILCGEARSSGRSGVAVGGNALTFTIPDFAWAIGVLADGAIPGARQKNLPSFQGSP